MKKPRNSGRVRAIIALGSVFGIGAIASLAAYSDTADFTSTFTTGSVDIALDGDKEGPADEPYSFSLWNDTAMFPGKAGVYASLEVNNNGTMPFTYTMSTPTFASGDHTDLRTAIQAGVRLTDTCNADGYGSGRVVVQNGNLSAMEITSGRRLAAGSSEKLCFYAELPAWVPSTTQGHTVHPVFQLTATAAS